MSEKTQFTIGQILTTETAKDAIHIAVVPVMVEEIVSAGVPVVLVPHRPGYVRLARREKPVGIIDPFLSRYVSPGEKVWLFLQPNTVTGMRHEWTHPTFDGAAQPEPTTVAEAKAESEQWLRQFADRWDFKYTEMIDSASGPSGDFVVANGHDLHGAHDLEPGDEALFWQHLETVTGKRFDKTHREAFGWSCSC